MGSSSSNGFDTGVGFPGITGVGLPPGGPLPPEAAGV